MNLTLRQSGIGLGVIAMAEIAFATQTADEVQSPVANKVEITHWLETGLWVNPGLFLVGALTLFLAAVLYLRTPQRPTVAYVVYLVIPTMVVLIALYIFVGWGFFVSPQPVFDISGWAPQ